MTKNQTTLRTDIECKEIQRKVDRRLLIKKTCEEIGVSCSIIENWISQLRREISEKRPEAPSMTPCLRRMEELEQRLKEIELEKNSIKNMADKLMESASY